MTEPESLQQAKTFIDKLANGIDPLTDRPVNDGDCINQVKISRCLFYVSDILRKVIENGGNTENIKKQLFPLSPDVLNGYTPSDTPLSVSEITKRINASIDHPTVTKLKNTSINAFLVKNGFLEERRTATGRLFKVPTELGKSVGISTVERSGPSGTFSVTVFNAEAQRFILDNIAAVIEENSKAATSPEKQADNQGRPWTKPEEEKLVELFRKNVPTIEIAAILKRTETGVRARLKRLGVIENRRDAE